MKRRGVGWFSKFPSSPIVAYSVDFKDELESDLVMFSCECIGSISKSHREKFEATPK